jgi:Xaa-Pro dipeptidase
MLLRDRADAGLKARDIHASWQAVVDDARHSHYRRHKCGYCVGV